MRQERLLLRYRLGLDEQFVEGRMLPVGVVRRHREFNITGEIEAAGAKGTVDQGDPPNLHVIFRGDDHLRFGLNSVIRALENGPVKAKLTE